MPTPITVNIRDANITSVRFRTQAGDEAAPATGYIRLYHKSDGLYITDEDGYIKGPFGRKNNYTAIVGPTVNDDINDGYEVGSKWINTIDGQTWTCTDNTADAALWATESTSDWNGFSTRAESTITYNSGTRTISIAPTSSLFNYYLKGEKHDINSAQTPAAHPDVTGGYFFYWDKDNNLFFSTSSYDFREDIPIAYVYYSQILKLGVLFEERHSSKRNPNHHYSNHYKRGTYWWESVAYPGLGGGGLTIGDYVLAPASPVDSDNQYSLTSGFIHDEDIEFQTNAIAAGGPYLVWYRSGATGEWVWDTNNVPNLNGGSYLYYNEFTGSTWQNTALATNRYVNYYLCATTSLTTGFDTFLIMGQNIHSTLDDAQAEAITDVVWGILPFQEILAAYKITFFTNAAYTTEGKCRIQALADTRLSTATAIINAPPAGVHGALSGLLADDHTQYLLLAGRSGGQIAYGGTDASDDITVSSTSNATKGNIILGTAGNSVYDEVNDRLGIGTPTPGFPVSVFKSFPDTSGALAGSYSLIDAGQASPSTATINAGFFQARQNSTFALSTLRGLFGGAVINSTGAITNAQGFTGSLNVNAGIATTITRVETVRAQAFVDSGATLTATDLRMLSANTPTGAGTYNVTNHVGLYVSDINKGTNNYSIYTNDGIVNLGGEIRWYDDITPPQITSDQNDYNPAGLSNASTLRLSSDASRNITGLAGGADGRILIMHNVGSNDIVLVDESASSTAANRFALNGNITLSADEIAFLQYDSTSSRWRVLSGGAGGGGGEANTASNVGTAGVGVFKQKTGVDLEFKKINAGSSKITVTDDTGNNEIDIDVAEAQLTLDNIGGTLSISKGGSGQTTQQTAINALTNVSAATNEYVLTKDTATGDAIFKVAAGRLQLVETKSVSGVTSVSFATGLTETYYDLAFNLKNSLNSNIQIELRVNSEANSNDWTYWQIYNTTGTVAGSKTINTSRIATLTSTGGIASTFTAGHLYIHLVSTGVSTFYRVIANSLFMRTDNLADNGQQTLRSVRKNTSLSALPTSIDLVADVASSIDGELSLFKIVP